MTYDWTQHVSGDRVSGGRAGRRTAEGVYITIRAPKALRFDWMFYARVAYDALENALSNCDTDAQRAGLRSAYNALMDLDRFDGEPFLTHLQRRASVTAAFVGDER